MNCILAIDKGDGKEQLGSTNSGERVLLARFPAAQLPAPVVRKNVIGQQNQLNSRETIAKW